MSCMVGIIFLLIILVVVGAFEKMFRVDREEISRKEQKLQSLESEIKGNERVIKSCLKDIFLPNMQYSLVDKLINENLREISLEIKDMEVANDRLKYLSKKKDQEEKISQYRDEIYPELKERVEKFNKFYTRLKDFTLLLDKENYGCINEQRLSSIMKIDRNYAVKTIEKYSTLIYKKNLTQEDLDMIYQINLMEVLGLIWYFATEKVYSVMDFSRAEDLFLKIYKKDHIEIIIAKLYTKKKIGGEDALRESVRDLLKEQKDPEKLQIIASGLMWMKAYQAESMVLKYMLENGMQMSSKAQERLQVLAKGGGKTPDGYSVESTNTEIYFDAASLSWQEEEYKNFFDNLAFHDSNLTYSLAVRDEDKELYVTRGIMLPKLEELHKKLKEVFEQEYEGEVSCNPVKAVALSGNDKEILEGILVSPQECRQMGILIYLIKIGKKLDIKFYTLAMPIRVTIEEQRQKTLALYKKLSPSLNVWESSLRETALIGIQQLLNMAQQTTSSEYESAARSEREKDEPVF